MNQPSSARAEFFAGMRAIIPLVIGATPFGMLFGALAISVGLSWWATMGLSLIVFAGSSQFVAAGLVGQGASVGIIIMTTFVVNLRHALYAASLGPYLRHLSHRWLAPLAFLLTDEAYAAVIARFEQADTSPNKHWFYFGGALLMYINWQLWTIGGIVAGQRIQGVGDLGLEFAMVVTFIGIVVPLIRHWPMLLCALVSGATALLLHSLPHQLGLILAALCGIVAGCLAQLLAGNNVKPPTDLPPTSLPPTSLPPTSLTTKDLPNEPE